MRSDNWKIRVSAKTSNEGKEGVPYRNKGVNISIAEHEYFKSILLNVNLCLRAKIFEGNLMFTSKEEGFNVS